MSILWDGELLSAGLIVINEPVDGFLNGILEGCELEVGQVLFELCIARSLLVLSVSQSGVELNRSYN